MQALFDVSESWMIVKTWRHSENNYILLFTQNTKTMLENLLVRK